MPPRRRALPRLCLVTAVILLSFWPSALARAAAGPEFLERDRLTIPLDRLAKGTWQVVLVNPGPATDVEVRLAGSVTDALALKGDSRVRLPPVGTATVTVAAGPRPHAGTGHLVLISAAGVDRLQVAVTPPPVPFVQRHAWTITGAGTVLLAAATAWLLRRRARRRPAKGAAAPAPRAPAAPESKGFTHTDEPALKDGLRREEYARHLADLARYATPPMVIGVFGEWGTGKTSMLMQVRGQLRDAPECAHVWYDPWQHQYDENPVLPLLHVIVKDLGLEGRENVLRTLRTISDVLGSLVLSAALKINLSDVRASVEDYDSEHFRIRSERTRLHEHLGALIDEALAASGKERLVVFVDDLDRCEADRITALLEALRLHFNRKNCVFVLGVAKGPLIAAVREKYKDPVGEYLDKIIQFPFEMPRLSEDDFARYLDGLLTDEIRVAGPMLRCGLRRNARAIKRFVNVLILQDRVAKDRRLDPYDVSVLAAVLLLRDSAPADYARLVADPALLRRLVRTPDLEPGAGLSELTLSIVRELRNSPSGAPDDMLSYIDLVRESPVPQPSELSSAAEQPPAAELSRQLELRAMLEEAATEARSRAGDMVNDLVCDGDPLEPVLRVRGAERTGLAALDGVLARPGAKVFLSGVPGVGKSVLAAGLARRLAERRGPQTPVLLSCGELPTRFAEHERWVTHALAAEYRLSAADAHAAVTRGMLVLILDGLEALEPGLRPGFLSWARATGCGVVVTGRDQAVPGFEPVTVLGVPATEARRRFEALLTTHRIDPDRLLGLTTELMSFPLLLGVLTRDQRWIDDLPEDPVRFLPWYADLAMHRTAAAGFAPESAELALGGLARATAARHHVFSAEDTDVRTRVRGAGVPDVPAFLDAAARAGLLREAASGSYHFVHPLLRERLAAGGR
ncbi:P-loop NTPase fold protein [Nonomuraea coxensis]|nr:P-loop NTPase fold protein [Nonomuraea coxensis]